MYRLLWRKKLMNITLNGQTKEINASQSLKDVVRRFCPNTTPVIAEVNGAIVKNPQWDTVTVKEGDSIALVNFVGGG